MRRTCGRAPSLCGRRPPQSIHAAPEPVRSCLHDPVGEAAELLGGPPAVMRKLSSTRRPPPSASSSLARLPAPCPRAPRTPPPDGRRAARARARRCRADRMRRLAGESERRDALAHAAIQLRQAVARPRELDGVAVDAHQPLLELAVADRELAADEVLRVIGPVPVGAHPDLEQRRLALPTVPPRSR